MRNTYNQFDTFKRNNILVDILFSAKGKSNAISSYEIAKIIESKGYKTKQKSVGVMVRNVMYDRKLPICHHNSKGYFWANNKTDIEECVAEMESRIEAMQKHIEHLKAFLIK